MKKYTKFIVFIAVMILGIGSMIGCQPKTEATTTVGEVTENEVVEIRLGVFNSRASFVSWYMTQNGLDVANGFKIIPTTTTAGGSVLNEAIGAGLLDATEMGAPAAVYTASTYNCVVLGELSEGSGGLNLFARPDSDIVKAKGANPEFPEILGSAETLVGKSIIYGFGSMGQYGVTAYLDLFGLTTDDITAINMNFGPGFQAFQAGEGDIVALFTPLNYTALENGYVKLANIADLNLPVRDVLLATPETMNDPEKLDALKSYLRLHYELAEKFNADPALQQAELVKYYEYHGTPVTSADLLTIEINDMHLITFDEAKAEIDTMGQSIIDIAEFYKKIGAVEQETIDTIKDNIDTTLLEEVLGSN